MKLITLNTWAGRLKEPFETFLKDHAEETDIFCFQEIFNNMEEGETEDYIDHNEGNKYILQEITATLPDFDGYFCPVAENVYGLAIFLKKGMEIVASGEVLLYQNPSYDKGNPDNDHDRKMQWVHVKTGRKDVMILNVHGHWDQSGKGDTENRIEQSKAINAFIASTGMVPKIMVGDFNLTADTESIKMLGEHFENLITKYNITTTRTELYRGDEKHSDYVFTSPEVLVEGFAVLPDVVSDHTPLALTFDVF